VTEDAQVSEATEEGQASDTTDTPEAPIDVNSDPNE